MTPEEAWGVGLIFGLAVSLLGLAFLPDDRPASRIFSLFAGSIVLAGAIAKALYT